MIERDIPLNAPILPIGIIAFCLTGAKAFLEWLCTEEGGRTFVGFDN